MTDAVKRKLGETAFLVTDDGSVTRTIINNVREENKFGLLEHTYSQPHFIFADAVAEASAKLKAKQQKLNNELAAIETKIALVSSPEYEQQVAGSVLKKVSGNALSEAFGLDGEVQEIPVPATYLEPGQKVFCVITPKTHNGVSPHYRPHAYFVLESSIQSVRLLENGKVYYNIHSNYFTQALFTDLEESKKELVRIFAAETGGELPLENVKLVPRQEEKDAEDASLKQISERVRGQFVRAPID